MKSISKLCCTGFIRTGSWAALAPGARASRGAAAARFPTQASSSSFRWVLGSILLAAGHSASPPTLALEQLGKALARRVRGEHGGVEGREAESSSRSGTEGVCRSVRAEDEEVETGVRIGQVASTDWFEGMMPPKGAGGGASACKAYQERAVSTSINVVGEKQPLEQSSYESAHEYRFAWVLAGNGGLRACPLGARAQAPHPHPTPAPPCL